MGGAAAPRAPLLPGRAGGRSYLDLAYHLGVNLAEVVVKAGTVVAGEGARPGAGP